MTLKKSLHVTDSKRSTLVTVVKHRKESRTRRISKKMEKPSSLYRVAAGWDVLPTSLYLFHTGNTVAALLWSPPDAGTVISIQTSSQKWIYFDMLSRNVITIYTKN